MRNAPDARNSGVAEGSFSIRLTFFESEVSDEGGGGGAWAARKSGHSEHVKTLPSLLIEMKIFWLERLVAPSDVEMSIFQ